MKDVAFSLRNFKLMCNSSAINKRTTYVNNNSTLKLLAADKVVYYILRVSSYFWIVRSHRDLLLHFQVYGENLQFIIHMPVVGVNIAKLSHRRRKRMTVK